MEASPTPEKPTGDLQDLIKLTEWEIKLMDDARREQGWSPWVLFVALAGLTWKLADELGQQHAWAHVGLYWAALTLIANLTEESVRMLMAGPRDRGPEAAPRYFSASGLLGCSRPYILFASLRTTVAALTVLLSGALAPWLARLWVTVFGLHLVGWLIALRATFLDVPLTVSTERAHSALRVGYGLAHVLNAGAIFLMSLELWPVLSAPFSAADLKLAFVLFAASGIVLLLLERPITNPIRDNLVQLRRSIGLAEMAYEDGRARLDLTLHGAEMSAYLRPRVQAFLTIMNEVTRVQDAALRLAEAAQAVLPPGMADAELAEVAGKAESLALSSDRLLGQAEKALEAFDLGVGVMLTFDRGIRERVRPLREGMARQLAEAKEKLASLEKKTGPRPEPPKEVPVGEPERRDRDTVI